MKIKSVSPEAILCEADPALREIVELVLQERFRTRSTSRVSRLPALLDACLTLRLLVIDFYKQPRASIYQILSNAARDLPSTRILLLASEFTLDEQERAIRLARVSFLPRPFDRTSLLEKIDILTRPGYRPRIRTRIVSLPVRPPRP